MEKFNEIRKKEAPVEQLQKKFGKYFCIILATIASFTISINKSEAQSNIDSTQENKIKNDSLDSKVKIEYEKQKEFLFSWYSDRIIDNKNYERKFKEVKADILERLKNVTLVESLETFGNGEWKNDTIFVNINEYNKDARNKTTFAHELSHDAFPANYGNNKEKFQTEMPKWMISLIAEATKKSGDKGLKSVEFFKKYYQRPEEIYARICALRYAYNFKPNQVITKNDLEIVISENKNEVYKDDNVILLLETISNIDSLTELLNKLP